MDSAHLLGELTDLGRRIELLKKAVAGEMDPGLYVRRRLLPVSATAFTQWARAQGFTNLMPAVDLHVTIMHSEKAIPWQSLPSHVIAEPPAGPLLRNLRSVQRLGDKGAVVLMFSSAALHARWAKAVREGAVWRYDGYRPHVTITYQGDDVDLDKVIPFPGMLEFGPEVQGPINDDWVERLKVSCAQ